MYIWVLFRIQYSEYHLFILNTLWILDFRSISYYVLNNITKKKKYLFNTFLELIIIFFFFIQYDYIKIISKFRVTSINWIVNVLNVLVLKQIYIIYIFIFWHKRTLAKQGLVIFGAIGYWIKFIFGVLTVFDGTYYIIA